jgi:hypothetical protein
MRLRAFPEASSARFSNNSAACRHSLPCLPHNISLAFSGYPLGQIAIGLPLVLIRYFSFRERAPRLVTAARWMAELLTIPGVVGSHGAASGCLGGNCVGCIFTSFETTYEWECERGVLVFGGDSAARLHYAKRRGGL